jgi:putative DNA primase/helicase
MKHAVHKAQNLPETIEDAWKILKALPFPPSLIIHSGHGLQPWWLFRELWHLETADDHRRAAVLNCRLQATLKAAARLNNWHMDGTADLARVLRIPRTFNRKEPGQPQLVSILEASPGVRYNPV